MEIELLKARIYLKHTCLKLQVSLDEIKEKNPHRSDLIISMENSLKDLEQSLFIYSILEKEFRATRQLNCELIRTNLVLLKDFETQKEINKNLLNKI